MTAVDTTIDAAGLAAFRREFHTWLQEAGDELAQFRTAPRTAHEQADQARALQRLLFSSGWGRRGWPEIAGGVGGSVLLRGIVAEELTRFGCPPPMATGFIEVFGPAVLRFGSPELIAESIPRLLDGTDLWCQGFSEPEAGSDLGALRTKAVDAGDHWLVSGQKIWTSYADCAQRCVLLARTGSAADGFKGITAMLMDMDSPGIDVRPLRAMTGDAEFAELFLDDVVVPKARTIGAVGGGVGVTMDVLANERSVMAWQRQAWLHTRLLDVVTDFDVDGGRAADERIGRAYTGLHALRLKSRETFTAVASGRDVGSETSVDKILLSAAEKGVFDTALALDPQLVLLDDGDLAERWRYDHTYSRASSIYGGTAEIQRNILAERVLGLPRER